MRREKLYNGIHGSEITNEHIFLQGSNVNLLKYLIKKFNLKEMCGKYPSRAFSYTEVVLTDEEVLDLKQKIEYADIEFRKESHFLRDFTELKKVINNDNEYFDNNRRYANIFKFIMENRDKFNAHSDLDYMKINLKQLFDDEDLSYALNELIFEAIEIINKENIKIEETTIHFSVINNKCLGTDISYKIPGFTRVVSLKNCYGACSKITYDETLFRKDLRELQVKEYSFYEFDDYKKEQNIKE